MQCVFDIDGRRYPLIILCIVNIVSEPHRTKLTGVDAVKHIAHILATRRNNADVLHVACRWLGACILTEESVQLLSAAPFAYTGLAASLWLLRAQVLVCCTATNILHSHM